MKKKLALFALLVVAASLVIAATPAIQTTTQNFESYSTKALTTKTTKPLTGTTQNTETLQSTIAPATESCATEQHPTLGENFYLCIRFNDDYERVGGSVEVLRYGHYYKWVLEDHELFDQYMTIACYVDDEFIIRNTKRAGFGFTCTGGGQSLTLEYEEFLRGDRAQCHEPCNDHDDEVDNSKMQAWTTQEYRLPSPKPKATTNPLDDFVKRFLAWLS